MPIAALPLVLTIGSGGVIGLILGLVGGSARSSQCPCSSMSPACRLPTSLSVRRQSPSP